MVIVKLSNFAYKAIKNKMASDFGNKKHKNAIVAMLSKKIQNNYFEFTD